MFLNTEILLFAKKEKENKYSAEATKNTKLMYKPITE